MNAERIDVRGLPVWERPARVQEAFERLPEDAAITLITENEPRGLAYRIHQRSEDEVVCDARRVSREEWHVTIKRVPADGEPLSPSGILRRCAVFMDLDGLSRRRIAGESTIYTVRRGQTIVGESVDWPYLGVACDGLFATSSEGGDMRHRIFFEIFPYEVFGEAEFFDESLTAARVGVLSKSARYLRIPRRVVHEVLQQSPDAMLRLARVVAQRNRHLMETLAAQPTMPVVARVARVLVPYAMPEKGLAPAAPPLAHLTQAQIAAAAGTVKEVAARAISDLEQAGLLKRERGHVHYLDRQRLIDLVRAGVT
jgi:CRP-like cAMP-binding protein